MAKKVLSFLCALAVLVSMTAIGMSSVFAEDTNTGTYDNEFKGLADATINYDSTGANSGTYESAADILDSTVSFTFQKNTPTTIDLGT